MVCRIYILLGLLMVHGGLWAADAGNRASVLNPSAKPAMPIKPLALSDFAHELNGTAVGRAKSGSVDTQSPVAVLASAVAVAESFDPTTDPTPAQKAEVQGVLSVLDQLRKESADDREQMKRKAAKRAERKAAQAALASAAAAAQQPPLSPTQGSAPTPVWGPLPTPPARKVSVTTPPPPLPPMPAAAAAPGTTVKTVAHGTGTPVSQPSSAAAVGALPASPASAPAAQPSASKSVSKPEPKF